MADVKTLIRVLEGEIGYRESGNNDTKYNRWLGKISGYPHSGYGYPWCASFASWAYAKAGLKAGADFPKTAGCLTAVSWYKARKRWGAVPRVGAQVLYGPGGGTHTEIVVGVSSTHITTIGGNTSGSLGGTYHNGDGVYKKTIRRSESRIYGYGYPTGFTTEDETDMPLSDADLRKIRDIVWNTDTAQRPDGTPASNPTWRHVNILRDTYATVRDVKGMVATLAAQSPNVDVDAVVSGVLAGLTPERIAAAIPAEIAGDVVEELARRMRGGVDGQAS